MSIDRRESSVDGRPSQADDVGAELARPAAEQAEEARPPDAHTRRVIVERIQPEIDGGRFPIKRTVGERVDVRADIFADGHEVVTAVLRHRKAAAEHAETADA